MGGTLGAARSALAASVGVNLAGGTHHAGRSHGEGFCVFNDFAIASNALLSAGRVEQILIVDLDVHQGNGSAHIFRNEPGVFTFSMHGSRNYPIRKEKSDLDIGLSDGTEDRLYLSILKKVMPEVIDTVQPDLIFYLAGVDVLASDQLGRLALTKNGCKERDRFVLEYCHSNKIPVAVSMGGGYSKRISDIIEAHANTFRLAQSIFF